jgi:hypothetical protein
MIVGGDKTTYCFHRRNKPSLHFGRIYISNVVAVRELLKIVKQYQIVSDEILKTSSTRVRSEHPREFLELLWLLKSFGIEVTRNGRHSVFVPNEDLDIILKLSNKELKELILEKLKMYAPFVAVLDKMIDYKNSNKKFTQNNITADFSEGYGQQTYQLHSKGDYYELKNFEEEIIFVWRGDTDNTEPLCRIANPENKGGFGLVDQPEKQINKNGEKYVQECLADRYWFFDYNVDLDSDTVLNIITHILSNTSVNTKKIEKKSVLHLLCTYHESQFTDNDLNDNLDHLISIGMPITFDDDQIKIDGKIFHRITKKDYVKFNLNKIDNIQLPKSIKTIESDVTIDDSTKIIIILDGMKDSKQREFFNPENYPKNHQILSYYEFKKIKQSLPDSNVNSIIIPSFWNPSEIGYVQGILLSFVRLGGNLIVENMNTSGRVGVNVNRYFWLPHDLKSIGSKPLEGKLTRKYPNLKGVFTFHDDYGGENFTYSKKITVEKIEQGYVYLTVGYFSGKIIFSTIKNYKTRLEALVETSKKFNINPDDPQWKYNYIPNIKQLPRVNTERQCYPHLEKIFNEFLGLRSQSLGASGETDLMISNPFSCCCEVGTYSSDVSGAEKIGEVARHRNDIDGKNQDIKKSGETPPYHDDIGCCVIAVSYSKEKSLTKSGAVDTALRNNVSLLTYMDIYELVCLNEKAKLTDIELEKIFFYQEGKSPEAAERIYELIKQKNCK